MISDINFFRQVMGRFATGVTVVTTHSQTSPVGLTINSFASVSLNPLLVLICVDLCSQVLPFFRESGVFAVNILTEEQEVLSKCFASSSEDRYTCFCHASHYHASTGAPILAGVSGFVDARITAEYPGGDHAIFIGQVEAMGYGDRTLFLTGTSSELTTLSNRASAVNCVSDDENMLLASGDPLPLLYYRGQYRHLPDYAHLVEPQLATTPVQRDI